MSRRAWHSNFKRARREDRTAPDGEVFDSVAEMHHWLYLQRLEWVGMISNLRRQVKFPLVILTANRGMVAIKIRSDGFPEGRPAVYHLDFQYDESGLTRHVEFKGSKFGDDEAARLRRAIVEAIYGIQIDVVYKRTR